MYTFTIFGKYSYFFGICHGLYLTRSYVLSSLPFLLPVLNATEMGHNGAIHLVEVALDAYAFSQILVIAR